MRKPTSQATPGSARARLKRAHRLAWLLDESIRLPGGIRIGVDGIIGLVPGIGDVLGALIGGYIIYEARALGVPKRLRLRMGMNLLIETVVGSIPLVGDWFDFHYKANMRNLAILNRHFQHKNKDGTR